LRWHEIENNEIEDLLQTDFNCGLWEKEVDERLLKNGHNELQNKKKKSPLIVFLSQFNDFMVYVLLGATALSFFLGDMVDAVAIIAIVLLNGILGFVQENKAEKSLEALKELSAPQVTVLREGKWVRKQSRDLVVGDVVKFIGGDRISADLRILQCASLYVEESALTGESVPVLKNAKAFKNENATIGDLENMCFMGTLVTQGTGTGVVVATGMDTAMGQIASLLNESDEMLTPLQRRLEQLGKILIAISILLTLLVVVLGVYQGQDLYSMFLAGISLAVAAIPEGLPAIVTVALSLGVQRMIKKNALVRKLQAVETLGCATVICSDKTGTMTQNKMMVTNVWASGHMWNVTGEGYEPKGQFRKDDVSVNPEEDRQLYQLLTFGLLCSDADVVRKKNEYIVEGDPTEGAIVVSALKAGIQRELLDDQFNIVKEFPFDSDRKMMTKVVKDLTGKRFIVTKGAPEIILENCTQILWNNRVIPISELYKDRVNSALSSLSSKALRTLAIAYRVCSPEEKVYSDKQAENNLIFVGIQGMYDPPRAEVYDAVRECKDAGIKTVMITGDHVLTAEAIAKDLNILPENGKVIEGVVLEELDDRELEDIVNDIYVFARVSPAHKLRIVKALQNKGNIVAMTGDGVNDAPAIKAADIGISMGINGTDVSKEASAMILMDDNFATIKSAIKEGRNIYENIRKFIRYLLASNVGEILVMLFAMLLALPLPLVPIQILWVNLVTDGLPAMALGLDQPEGDLMNKGPRSPKEGVFARGLWWKIISRGFLIGIATLFAFIVAYNTHPDDLKYAQTVAFSTLVLAQLIHVFDCRSEHSILSRNPFENMALVWAVLSSLILMLVVIYAKPLQPIFDTVAIMPKDWLLIVGMAAIPTFLLAGFALPGSTKIKKQIKEVK
jgi:Ca2+-transporting ATPase